MAPIRMLRVQSQAKETLPSDLTTVRLSSKRRDKRLTFSELRKCAGGSCIDWIFWLIVAAHQTASESWNAYLIVSRFGWLYALIMLFKRARARTNRHQMGQLGNWPLSAIIAHPQSHSGCGAVTKWSGRADLNRRPPVPKTGALPDCATPRKIRIKVC